MADADDVTRQPSNTPDRAAYRLGYEAAKELIAHELETVRSYQGRSVVLLSVTAVVVGIGIGGPGGAGLASATGCWQLIGWQLVTLGLLSSLVGALSLNRPLKGAFDPLPRSFVTIYGDDVKRYPTNDDAYRAMALDGAQASNSVRELCRKRCRWLWASLAGPPLAVAGLAVLWASAY